MPHPPDAKLIDPGVRAAVARLWRNYHRLHRHAPKQTSSKIRAKAQVLQHDNFQREHLRLVVDNTTFKPGLSDKSSIN